MCWAGYLGGGELGGLGQEEKILDKVTVMVKLPLLERGAVGIG